MKPLWQYGDPVAVAHPHRILFALAPHAFEQWRVLGDRHFGATEFAMMPALDLATELVRHRLLAVADAEHRHARFIDRFRRERRILIENRRGPAREDDGLRLHLTESSFGLLVRNDLGIDLFLPDPARDELGDLGAEIDDQNLVVHGRRVCPNVSGIGRADAVRAGFLRALHFGVKPFGVIDCMSKRLTPGVVDHGTQKRNVRYPFADT